MPGYPADVHPIEHLRYLARADSAEAARMVGETATALGSLGNDPAMLVVAVRRILERHAAVGPMWWMCAHLLVAGDVYERAWDLADELADDPTADRVADELARVEAGDEPTVVVLAAGSPDVQLVPPKQAAAARVAAAAGDPVWLVTPVGTCLPTRYVQAVAAAAGERLVRLEAPVARVIGPYGASTELRVALAPTAPTAPELLRLPAPSPVGS